MGICAKNEELLINNTENPSASARFPSKSNSGMRSAHMISKTKP